MRKFLLAAAVVVFAGACGHKKTASDSKTNDTTPAAPTKDQGPATKTKKVKKATAATTASTAGSVKCTHNRDERTLEIAAKDGGCEVIYTKMGEAKSVASSVSGNAHCQEVSEKIQKKLADAGFTCQ